MAHDVYSCGAYINVITTKIMENLLYRTTSGRACCREGVEKIPKDAGSGPRFREMSFAGDYEKMKLSFIAMHLFVGTTAVCHFVHSIGRSVLNAVFESRTSSTCARRAFSVAGPFVWNSLPDYTETQFTRYDLLSKRLSNRFDNRLDNRRIVCIQTSNRLSSRLYNRFDNRLYRVDGV